VISFVKLLARSKFLTTSADALVVIDIVLPAAIVKIMLNLCKFKILFISIMLSNVLLGLVGVGETVYIT
jgi:hypothetical protein